METKKNQRYRVHAVVHNSQYNSDCELRYELQKRRFGIWWTLSHEIKSEQEAIEMCDKLNGYNTEKV